MKNKCNKEKMPNSNFIIFKELNFLETQEVLSDTILGDYSPLRVLKDHLTDVLLNTRYNSTKNLEENMSLIFDKTGLEQIIASGYRGAVYMGSGSYAIDMIKKTFHRDTLNNRIHSGKLCAFDIKSVGFLGSQSGETSICQEFGPIDNDFIFLEHLTIEEKKKKAEIFLRKRLNGVFEKWKTVKIDHPSVENVYYYFTVRNNADFQIIVFELFPSLSKLTIDEINAFDLEKHLENQDLLHEKSIAHLNSSSEIKSLWYNDSIVESINCDVSLKLYKAKRRIEMRLKKKEERSTKNNKTTLKSYFTIKLNNDFFDNKSLLHKDITLFYEKIQNDRFNENALEEKKKEQIQLLSKHKFYDLLILDDSDQMQLF